MRGNRKRLLIPLHMYNGTNLSGHVEAMLILAQISQLFSDSENYDSLSHRKQRVGLKQCKFSLLA